MQPHANETERQNAPGVLMRSCETAEKSRRCFRQPAQYGTKMHDLFYCKLAGDYAERCLALAAALQNAPDFVFLEQAFAPEADIFCFIFLPAQKSFRFKCDLVYGQSISSSENWTANETKQLQNAVNQIAGRLFQTK